MRPFYRTDIGLVFSNCAGNDLYNVIKDRLTFKFPPFSAISQPRVLLGYFLWDFFFCQISELNISLPGHFMGRILLFIVLIYLEQTLIFSWRLVPLHSLILVVSNCEFSNVFFILDDFSQFKHENQFLHIKSESTFTAYNRYTLLCQVPNINYYKSRLDWQ